MPKRTHHDAEVALDSPAMEHVPKIAKQDGVVPDMSDVKDMLTDMEAAVARFKCRVDENEGKGIVEVASNDGLGEDAHDDENDGIGSQDYGTPRLLGPRHRYELFATIKLHVDSPHYHADRILMSKIEDALSDGTYESASHQFIIDMRDAIRSKFCRSVFENHLFTFICMIDKGEADRSLRSSPLKMTDYGPHINFRMRSDSRRIQTNMKVLRETLTAFEEHHGMYRQLARFNMERWHSGVVMYKEGLPVSTPGDWSWNRMGGCVIFIAPADWGDMTLQLSKMYGETFAVLNMANAYYPGGGYDSGCVAQEENMFRRTDCHFALTLPMMWQARLRYRKPMTDLISAANGRVYIDVDHPRVCIRGSEAIVASDVASYEWLDPVDVFPFIEMRAAAVDLGGGAQFDEAETTRRIVAQFDTLIECKIRHVVLSAFGCGAFENPADRVAAIYHRELACRAEHFDVVAFAIFHAGYGPRNVDVFEREFGGCNI